jgi:hypothetical protein
MTNARLKQRQHLVEALAVEVAKFGSLGIGQPNDGAPKRSRRFERTTSQ